MRRAEDLEHLLRDAVREVALARGGVRGLLRIGGTPDTLVSLVPQAVVRMEADGSRFSLHVVERPGRMPADILRRARST